MEDGSKQILFQGQDEATAVKEIYDCLLKVLQNSEGPDSYDPDDTYENLNANEAYSAPVEENVLEREEPSMQEPSAPEPSALAEDSMLEKINNSEAIYNSILGEPYSSDLFGDSVVDDTKSSDLTEGRGYSRENNNSSAEEEKDKSIPEDSFRFEDVKDLKTGIVFFLYKLSYYVGRFFYYMSMIFFALNRVFINICLYLRQRLTDPKKKDVRTESFKEIVEDIKSSEKIADFEEKDFDDKISFLWATTKYYTSRLFFHISKLSLRFSNYCSDGLTKSYSIVNPGNPGNTDGMIGSGNTVSTADTDNPGNTADANNTADALSFTLKEDAAPIEEAQNYDQSQVAREYESPKYDLNKIAREYDGTVDEYVPSYNLSEVADDDSIDALTDSLDEDGSSYSDYNDEFDDVRVKSH